MTSEMIGHWYGPIQDKPGPLPHELAVELSRRALSPDEWDAWLLRLPEVIADRERLIDERTAHA